VSDIIDTTDLGTRTIAGTEHPVVDQLLRASDGSWQVIRELCHLGWRSVETYSLEADAREAFRRRSDGKHRQAGAQPRAGVAAEHRVSLRLTDEESGAIKEHLHGRSISDWVRGAIRRELGVIRWVLAERAEAVEDGDSTLVVLCDVALGRTPERLYLDRLPEPEDGPTWDMAPDAALDVLRLNDAAGRLQAGRDPSWQASVWRRIDGERAR
jgi:hypothetical protein